MSLPKKPYHNRSVDFILRSLGYADTDIWVPYPKQRSYIYDKLGIWVIPKIVLWNKHDGSLHHIKYDDHFIDPEKGLSPVLRNTLMIENYILSQCIAEESQLDKVPEMRTEILYGNGCKFKIETQQEELDRILAVLPECRARSFELGLLGSLDDLVFANQLGQYWADSEMKAEQPKLVMPRFEQLQKESEEEQEKLKGIYHLFDDQ